MIDDAPPLLAVRGQLAILKRPLIAIVGSRNASAAGVKFAPGIARELGKAQFGVVSGLARGIDAAAHLASLALGVVIEEAARRSGSLITARLAGEQGREVFAVPGHPLDPRAEGTNGLIKQGATLVTSAADVIALLEPILGRAVAPLPAREPDLFAPPDGEPADDERARIVSLLGPAPAAIDDLVRLSGAKAAIVRTALLELEIAGRLERHGGWLVSLV